MGGGGRKEGEGDETQEANEQMKSDQHEPCWGIVRLRNFKFG